MKIYTKKGDSGTTGLLGGTRVPKHHLRIEAYGTMDELNSWVGVLAGIECVADQRALLLRVQSHLFTLGSHLARDPAKDSMTLPRINPILTNELEQAIDLMEQSLPPLTNFILPGGSRDAAWCHVARCVCRRAERCTTALAESEQVDPLILAFLNRFSDYLFVLGRYVSLRSGSAEVVWKP